MGKIRKIFSFLEEALSFMEYIWNNNNAYFTAYVTLFFFSFATYLSAFLGYMDVYRNNDVTFFGGISLAWSHCAEKVSSEVCLKTIEADYKNNNNVEDRHFMFWFDQSPSVMKGLLETGLDEDLTKMTEALTSELKVNEKEQINSSFVALPKICTRVLLQKLNGNDKLHPKRFFTLGSFCDSISSVKFYGKESWNQPLSSQSDLIDNIQDELASTRILLNDKGQISKKDNTDITKILEAINNIYIKSKVLSPPNHNSLVITIISDFKHEQNKFYYIERTLERLSALPSIEFPSIQWNLIQTPSNDPDMSERTLNVFRKYIHHTKLNEVSLVELSKYVGNQNITISDLLLFWAAPYNITSSDKNAKLNFYYSEEEIRNAESIVSLTKLEEGKQADSLIMGFISNSEYEMNNHRIMKEQFICGVLDKNKTELIYGSDQKFNIGQYKNFPISSNSPLGIYLNQYVEKEVVNNCKMRMFLKSSQNSYSIPIVCKKRLNVAAAWVTLITGFSSWILLILIVFSFCLIFKDRKEINKEKLAKKQEIINFRKLLEMDSNLHFGENTTTP